MDKCKPHLKDNQKTSIMPPTVGGREYEQAELFFLLAGTMIPRETRSEGVSIEEISARCPDLDRETIETVLKEGIRAEFIEKVGSRYTFTQRGRAAVRLAEWLKT